MLDICSICLFTNIELQTLEEPLINFYDELCYYSVEGYAVYCAKCVHLLRKFYNFRNKCRKANIVLRKWKKETKLAKIPINKLHANLPNSIGLSNGNNHAIYSYNAKTEKDYMENNTDNLLTPSTDVCNDHLINSKPGFVTLDSTCPVYNKDAILIKRTDLILEEIVYAETSIDKTVEHSDILSSRTKVENEKHEIRITKSRMQNVNKFSHNSNSLDGSSINYSDTDIFTHKTNVKNDKNEKNRIAEEVEAAVKIELENEKDYFVAEELKLERNNDYGDDVVLNDDAINDNDQDVDNDAINSEVIKNCGITDSDLDIEKLLKEALESDLSDDEVLPKKRSKVISSCKKTDTIKKKEVSKKRKSKGIKSDDLELTKDEPKQKKPRMKHKEPNFEEIKKDVKRRLGNGDVKDKDGNIIDVDVIVNNLDKMHKYTYNKIKRFCAGNKPLSSEAIHFLEIILKRYGNQYSSIFITKHLTTDEEIMEEFRKRETNQNYMQCEHKCTRCFRYFRFAKMLDYHIAQYHDTNKPHKCRYCGVSFNSPPQLQKHLASHRVVHQCKLCPFLTNYTNVMETHFNFHKGVRYKCTKCDADFKSPPSLAAHMNSSVHQSGHICPCCARHFQTEHGLHQHKMKKHPNQLNTVGPPSAKCEQCHIQFISDEVYLEHQRKRHSDAKNIISGINMSKKRKLCSNRRTPRFTCRMCNGVESSMGALIWHFKSEHPNEEFDTKSIALRDTHKYLCHQCGKGFHMITSYTDHKNVHTGARPYACTECPKAFHNRTSLRNHLATHLPPAEECPQCGKKFHSKSNLSNHMRCHSGERRYACKTCGKTFLHQNAVTAHVRGVHLHIRRKRKHTQQHEFHE